ncbi:MAG TPA: hypothetical protein VEY33_11400 [Gemmatimonadota bacterium]|nr:hypothetical protein [Gemmatimonadota bacterium]
MRSWLATLAGLEDAAILCARRADLEKEWKKYAFLMGSISTDEANRFPRCLARNAATPTVLCNRGMNTTCGLEIVRAALAFARARRGLGAQRGAVAT